MQDLGIIDHAFAVPCKTHLCHGQAMKRIRLRGLTVRRLSRRNTTQFIQMKRGDGLCCQLQMPDMYRVKSTAKNANQFQVDCAGAAPSLSGNTSR